MDRSNSWFKRRCVPIDENTFVRKSKDQTLVTETTLPIDPAAILVFEIADRVSVRLQFVDHTVCTSDGHKALPLREAA